MAPIALSHVDGISDSARARELYKYYQPNTPINGSAYLPPPSYLTGELVDGESPELHVTSNVTSSKISSPDTALTAFCQLVTWRTGAQRAMLSVVDHATQYFIAESTKTIDLLDSTHHAPGDDLWMGCSSVSVTGRLCERTIRATPTKSEDYPSFIVNDLTKHESFNKLPFVTGPPFLKFYAGVPLVTKRGIPIGSLFIVDPEPRDGLSKEDIHFMGIMADTVMRHLEMVREVEEHRRGMKMSRGLASFVEGRAELVEAESDTENEEGTKIAGQFETDSAVGRAKSKAGSTPGSIHSGFGSACSIEHKEIEYSNAMVKAEQEILDSHNGSLVHSTHLAPDCGLQPNSFTGTNANASSLAADLLDDSTPGDKSETSTMEILFSRAANLIREAFEVEGGCVFYDAQRGFDSQAKPTREDCGDDLPSSGENHSDHDKKSSGRPKSTSTGLGEGLFSRSVEAKKPVEILGFSTAAASSINGDEYPCPGPEPRAFIPFDEKSLHTLLRRYPRGKLWTFDTDGSVSSSSEEKLSDSGKDPTKHRKDMDRRRVKKDKSKADAKFLASHFPGVRQLLFVPLWDSGRSRWLSGCFVWSTEPTRILSKQSELAFLTAFGNSVMAEYSRIDTEIADQKKGDFIGSISHELRSPLHGILASAEFLGEESLNAFVRGLVETIDSCGRTLLDTINHILDFSKINHFEKTWRKNKRGGNRLGPPTESALAVRQPDVPMMNLFAEVDISVVCEEVVESVFAGHVFQNMTAQSFDMVPGARGKMSDPRRFIPDTTVSLAHAKHPEVAVILDVDIQDYNFTTQPGAVRRVIMNLLGNALKYTSHGYVHVTLQASEIQNRNTPGSPDQAPRSMVTLMVTDTGKGISNDFLRSKLFTPFAQENSLSSGTGLGLSIVRSIVNLLEGEITIDSEVGRGTQVKVSLPLLREMPNIPDSAGSARSATSLTREADESIATLRARVAGKTVSLYGFDIDTLDPITRQMGDLLRDSIKTFLTKWYGLQLVPLGQRSSIIIANETPPTAVCKLIRQGTTNGETPTILVLCSHSSRFDRTISPTTARGNVGSVAKPVGPLKLARALLQCIEGAPPLTTPGLVDSQTVAESTDLSGVFEELSTSPHRAEVLDNSRMAAGSDNARKAIESPSLNPPTEKVKEFPFPVEKPPVSAAESMPGDKEIVRPRIPGVISTAQVSADMGTSSHTSNTFVAPTPTSLPKPRLLLVDDNRINLTLLRTYMSKRKYEIMDEAENGLEAVNKFHNRADGYDIIFMDISMPVLDGFGATRQIRAIEASRRNIAAKQASETSANDAGEDKESNKGGEQKSKQTPALVIALTGLASSRDQNEALASGIDLFLTKPVAFKEVGKMLDNWEANRAHDSQGATTRDV